VAWRTLCALFRQIGLALPRKALSIPTLRLSLVWLCRPVPVLISGHASLLIPTIPQGMIDSTIGRSSPAEATVKIDSSNNIRKKNYCVGEAFRQAQARKGPFG